MRIWIAHGSVTPAHPVGADILGMHDVLAACGFEVALVADSCDAATAARARVTSLADADRGHPPEILIYHHSTHWPRGEAFLGEIGGSRLLKYHGPAPTRCFEGILPAAADAATAAYRQTRRLCRPTARFDGFAADCAQAAGDLTALGAAGVAVLPPFTDLTGFLVRPSDDAPAGPIRLLAAGSPAPHGHHHLLSIVAAYKAAFGPGIALTILGRWDGAFEDYHHHIRHQARMLGIRRQVSILEPTDAAGLSALLSEASVFVCMSDHPDLSVPLTEAQARGVPIIAAEGAAIRDRLGPGQLVVDQPKTAADYAVLAELVRAVRTDRALRRQLITAGQRNVLRRFTPETIGDRLLGWLFPVLERLAA